MSQGAKSCECCAAKTPRQYTPPPLCRERMVHDQMRWICADCEKAGAPELKPEPIFGPAPHNGTETSEEAAHLIEGKMTQQCFTVLGVVAAAGPQGVTREEVCQRAGVVNQAACARLNTLEQHGLVIVDGEKRMASTRRSQQVYRLSAFQSARAAA